MNSEREKHEAIKAQDHPPIDPRYYSEYSDVIGRMGVDWFERAVVDYETDHPRKP